MNKIVSTKKISATFLAIVLIIGTITMISPSFMTSAQAITMDNNNNFKKSFGKDVSIKYVKCNNINVNVNGLELDINDLPNGFLGADAAETQASGLSGGMGGSSNGPSGLDKDGFVFVCINNNNKSSQDEGNGETNACEQCFEDNLNSVQFATLQNALTDGVIINIGPEISEVNSLEEYCNLLEAAGNIAPGNLVGAIESLIANAGVTTDLETFEEVVNALFACLVEALDIELPPPI